MLFFELFPAFLALVSVVLAVVLYAADRRARDRGELDPPIAPRQPVNPTAPDQRGPGRPSMSA